MNHEPQPVVTETMHAEDASGARVLLPGQQCRVIVSNDSRAAAIAKLREYADQLESGELEGVRMQWRDGLDHIEAVEMNGTTVGLYRYDIVGI